MANISINGANYTDVPRIDVPKTGGGGNASFYETSSDTATAADIAYGKTAHGASGLITGEATPSTPVLQSKTVTPGRSQQTVSPDSGYDGLSSVSVDASPVRELTVSAGMAGNSGIMPASSYVGFAPVNVQPLQNKTVTPSTQQQTIMADNYNNYSGLGVVTVEAINLQSKQVTPTSSQQVITADSGYDGLEEVIVDASSGGSSAVLQPTKSVTPQDVSVTVEPDAGYDAIEEVVVAPDNMSLASSKAASDVSAPGNAVLLDFENGFSQNTFYGWGTYFRSNLEDQNITYSDFNAPKYCKIKLPKNITAIGGRAFVCMSGLCEVDANPDNNVTVNARAFYGCTNLQTIGGLWAKLYSVYGNSFRIFRQGNGSASLFERTNDVVAPVLYEVAGGSSNGYSMSRGAFKSFTAPRLRNVGSYMFFNCYYLQTLDFTDLTSIEAGAFQGCSSLTDIYLRNTSQVVTLQNTNAFNGLYNVTVHVPSSLLSSYQNDTNWGASGVTIVAI